MPGSWQELYRAAARMPPPSVYTRGRCPWSSSIRQMFIIGLIEDARHLAMGSRHVQLWSPFMPRYVVSCLDPMVSSSNACLWIRNYR
jgi:hypothetical protein